MGGWQRPRPLPFPSFPFLDHPPSSPFFLRSFTSRPLPISHHLFHSPSPFTFLVKYPYFHLSIFLPIPLTLYLPFPSYFLHYNIPVLLDLRPPSPIRKSQSVAPVTRHSLNWTVCSQSDHNLWEVILCWVTFPSQPRSKTYPAPE